MKKLSYLFVSGLASTLMLVGGGALTVVGGGCSSGGSSGAKGGTSGTDGGGGSTGTPIPSTYIPLPSSPTGFVQDTTGGTNVIGAWYAYGDGVGSGASVALMADNANSDCVKKGMFPPSACSQILSPSPGLPFPPTDVATSAMCTSGTAAVVMNKGGAADYSDLWGSGIGLDFNNPGGDAGVKGYLDLSAYKGIYFQFYTFPASTGTPVTSNGAGPPAMAMRVNFPNQTQHMTDSPYWMGATKSSSPLTSPGGALQEETVLFADVGGPAYLSSQTPPVDLTLYPFSVNAVQAIQFQVFTNTTSATPYSFCVANLALIPK